MATPEQLAYWNFSEAIIHFARFQDYYIGLISKDEFYPSRNHISLPLYSHIISYISDVEIPQILSLETWIVESSSKFKKIEIEGYIPCPTCGKHMKVLAKGVCNKHVDDVLNEQGEIISMEALTSWANTKAEYHLEIIPEMPIECPCIQFSLDEEGIGDMMFYIYLSNESLASLKRVIERRDSEEGKDVLNLHSKD